MNWQVFDALGIFLGFTANLIASTAGKSSGLCITNTHNANVVEGPAAWRWQVGSSVLPAVALFWGTMFVCWDSPRFLMKHERRFQRQYRKRHPLESFRRRFFATRPRPSYRSDAYNTLLLLRGEPILAAKELIYAHCQLLIEKGSRKGADFQEPMSSEDFSLEYGSGLRAWASRFKRLFTEGFIRRALMAAATVMVCQQLCGINILMFYSANLFCQTGNDESTALRPLLLTWGLGLCNVVFAFPAYKWIESKGRRRLIILTMPPLAILMAIIAAILAKQEPRPLNHPTPLYSEGRRDATIFLAYLFTAIYSFGLGPVPFTLSAEVFPLEERMVGMSVAVALNFLGAGCLTLLVPPLTDNPAVLLGPFAALNFVGFIFVWAFVREVAKERPVKTQHTGADNAADRQKRMEPLTLEGLFKVFEPSVSDHIGFRWKRLRSWRITETESFIEYHETKQQQHSTSNNASTRQDTGAPAGI
jgi:MFS family permease